jgi:hypothetical protein
MQPNPIQRPIAADAEPRGWREVSVRYPDGTRGYREEPLPPDAFLDPQEGDHFIQGTEHTLCVQDLAARLRLHFRRCFAGCFGRLGTTIGCGCCASTGGRCSAMGRGMMACVPLSSCSLGAG